MFGIAAVGYVLFSGGLPFQNEKTVKKLTDDSKEKSAEEKLEKELLSKFEEGNHQQVFKLWQRVKTFEKVPVVSLAHIVESMKQLKKPSAEIVGEIRTALECNDAFADREVLAGLLTPLAKDGSLE